jgi:hypothetical protein
MKSYPHLPGWSRVGGAAGGPVYVFDKLDGSNVRVEVDRKGRLTKFGKREGLLDDLTPHLREAEVLIPEKYGDDFGKVVRDNRWEKATFYMEFWGPTSFAGWHAAEPHTVTLFDVAPHKKGFLEPREFLRVCGHLDHARLLHHGNFTHEIAEAVSNGTLEGMTFEGVVAKGAWDRKAGMPLMFKWKNLAWFQKLRERCQGDEALFNKLA